MTPTPNQDGTATVVLPATKPEGHEWVAAFRQPVPMQGMANLCKAVAECYGADAKLTPTGEWLAVSGTLCRPAAPRPAPGLRAWRVCEMRPLEAADGASVQAATPLEAAAKLLARHTGLQSEPALYVWPDGEHPNLSNLLTIPMAAVMNANPADA